MKTRYRSQIGQKSFFWILDRRNNQWILGREVGEDWIEEKRMEILKEITEAELLTHFALRFA